MSQHVHNRVNTRLAALGASAVVVTVLSPVTGQAPAALRAADDAVQLAANGSGLATSAERVGAAIISAPVVAGVLGYSVAFGDQQTLADQLNAVADAPAWALTPALEEAGRQDVIAAVQSSGDPVKRFAASFTTKTPNPTNNPTVVLINGAPAVAQAAFDELAQSPQHLSEFVTHVADGDNTNIYRDLKRALESPLTVTGAITPASTKVFGSAVSAAKNFNRGIESNLAQALNVPIGADYNPTATTKTGVTTFSSNASGSKLLGATQRPSVDKVVSVSNGGSTKIGAPRAYVGRHRAAD